MTSGWGFEEDKAPNTNKTITTAPTSNTSTHNNNFNTSYSQSGPNYRETVLSGPSSNLPPSNTIGSSNSSSNAKAEDEENVLKSEIADDLWEALHEVDVKLADKQADVNSPLFSVKTFEQLGLAEDLLKGIYGMHFVKPSKVQERALPLLLSNPPTNLIGQSQSGTGKTAAFVLTMLSRVDAADPKPQAVCLAPTRELAKQIFEVATQMGQFTRVKIYLASREEVGTKRQSIMGHQVVIGTPGTLLDIERRGMMPFDSVRVFVLDEADVMLDRQGMGMQSLRVRKACPENAQSIFFSATFTEPVLEFAHRICPNANQFTLKRDELSVDGIRQFYMDCKSFPHKFEMLSAIYGLMTVSQSIIFVNTRATADQVQAHMEHEGHKTAVLHGAQSIKERDDIIAQFRKGLVKVLISTNVLARGIDVMQVSLVINFDLPRVPETHAPDPETYLHRIGRTGRFGRTGVAINFVHNKEAQTLLMAYEQYFGKKIVYIPTDSLEKIESKLSPANNDIGRGEENFTTV